MRRTPIGPVTRQTALEHARWFVFEHFEQMLVILLVASMLVIHRTIDFKTAFLSFYYLPVIVAGFYLGRRGAVYASVFIVGLVAFFQAVVGLDGTAGLDSLIVLFTLVPWAGFLIITGYTVGTLADQRRARIEDLKRAYMTMLELLTFHLEASERSSRGHSFRVADRSVALGRELGMRENELEDLRVAALLHELGPQDPRLLRLFEQFPGAIRQLPITASMRAALDLVSEYSHYHEHVGADWPVDLVRGSLGVKVLAVADAFETLQMPSPNRPPFSPWSAVEEIERGAGQIFATEVVRALRKIAAAPERAVDSAPDTLSLEQYRERVAAR
jgi:HD-GYP domain-containing protein (c-di-GMP phosphodiesterase class II)